MENKLEKNAQVIVDHLANNEFGMFKQAFDTASRTYIRRYVRENSISERILDVVNVTRDHPKVQIEDEVDVMYYLEAIEVGATALQVSIRGSWEPRFVDGKRYRIEIGKIESEPVKKPQLELMVANNLVKMVKENNAEQIRRTQDIAFMSAMVTAIAANGNVLGGAGVSYATAVDWATTGPVKIPFTNLKSKILGNELLPAKWLMSETMWNAISSMDAGEIGDLSGDMLSNGMPSKKLLELPVETTIKTTLTDGTNYFFDHTDGTKLYTDIWLVVDKGFLGKIIKVGTDQIWSEWKKDKFHWNSWRYCGLGFGDSRGIARLRVKLIA